LKISEHGVAYAVSLRPNELDPQVFPNPENPRFAAYSPISELHSDDN